MAPRVMAATALLLPAAAAAGSTEVSVALRGGGTVTVAAATPTSFRLSVSFDGGTPPLPSPSIDPSARPAATSPVAWGGMKGLKAPFGALLVSDAGEWALYDADNATVVRSAAPPALYPAGNGVVGLPVADVTHTAQPCLGNGQFGPPFHWLPKGQSGGGYLAYAVSSWLHDEDKIHCFPAGFDGRVPAPPAPTPAPAPKGNTCKQVLAGHDIGGGHRTKAHPGPLNGTTQATCCAACNADEECETWIWSDGTHPDPNGDCWLMYGVGDVHARDGRVIGGRAAVTPAPAPPGPPAPPAGSTVWWAKGRAADWYLAPAAAGYDFSRALFQITGAPRVPPRYAMGFMATYWGYRTMQEVEGYMVKFRDGAYPIDSFIMDYDWWKCGTDVDWGPDGLGSDFAYCTHMFGNESFADPGHDKVETSGPTELLRYFHEKLNMRFGGIRKPRSYSNVDLSKKNGWQLPDKDSVGAGGNNWNYSAPGMQEWYTKNHLHFLKEGIDFWWNDEGETQWYTYLWWNQAQEEQWRQALPNQRMFTINRAFQPGMQRFPATSWTGDGQDCSHKKTLDWSMYGQPYTSCDMTGGDPHKDATVLVRQYQNGVFSPIMRVHQMHGTPRFPFLWGTDEHHAAFRKALDTRYAFLPHLYSIVHDGRSRLRPVARPAMFEFPTDPSLQPGQKGYYTYMVGDSILPADVSTAHRADAAENTTTANLPANETWYMFNSTAAVVGGWTDVRHDVPVSVFPVYIRAGAILTLQQAAAQHTGELGGALEVQVYAGRDGAFTLVEDDGATLDYETGYAAATRETRFSWDDAAKTLKWAVSGGYGGGATAYTDLSAVLFVANATEPRRAAARALGSGGSLTF